MESEPVRTAAILIIDDNADNVRLLGGMLKDQAQILFALDGETGLKLAKQHRPQLILLDVEMPGLDGYEVCRRLKANSDTQNSAVIFVTAHTTMADEIKALDIGAVDFIPKPFNAAVVRARVRTHLQLKQQVELLENLASTDTLTGLSNRRYFDKMLNLEFQRHRRQQAPLALALIDIDHFKVYNDTYGHPAGDACLIQVAHAIRATSKRPFEVVARYGGEEFIVLLPGTTASEALKYGSVVCHSVQSLALPHAQSSTGPVVTISTGVCALTPGAADTHESLIEATDRALYQAKHEGRNRAILAGAT